MKTINCQLKKEIRHTKCVKVSVAQNIRFFIKMELMLLKNKNMQKTLKCKIYVKNSSAVKHQCWPALVTVHGHRQ